MLTEPLCCTPETNPTWGAIILHSYKIKVKFKNKIKWNIKKLRKLFTMIGSHRTAKMPWMFSTKSLFFHLPLRNFPVCDVNELIVHVIFRNEMETHQALKPRKSNLFFRCTDIFLVHQILILMYGKHPREGRLGSRGGWSTMWSVLVSTLDCGLGTCPQVHTYPFVDMSGSHVGGTDDT